MLLYCCTRVYRVFVLDLHRNNFNAIYQACYLLSLQGFSAFQCIRVKCRICNIDLLVCSLKSEIPSTYATWNLQNWINCCLPSYIDTSCIQAQLCSEVRVHLSESIVSSEWMSVSGQSILSPQTTLFLQSTPHF